MPEGIAIELAPGVRVVWDDLEQARTDLAAQEATARWRLDGDLRPSHSALRVLTGAPGNGSLILLAAARPADADGHDTENPQAVLVPRSGDLKPIDEALLSTQYSADGRIERIGLELYAKDDDYPIRGAGDVRRAAAAEKDSLRREQAWLDFRLDGEPGDAILDIVWA